MNLEDIKLEWSKDSNISEVDLSRESLKTPKLHHKYLGYYADSRIEFQKLKLLYDKHYKIRYYYYAGYLSKEELEENNLEPFGIKVIKTDMPIYLNADEKLQKIKFKMTEAEEKSKYLENVLRSINSREYAIKNSIEFLKFTSGM